MSLIGVEGFDFYGNDWTDFERGPHVRPKMFNAREEISNVIDILNINGGQAIAFTSDELNNTTEYIFIHCRSAPGWFATDHIIAGICFQGTNNSNIDRRPIIFSLGPDDRDDRPFRLFMSPNANPSTYNIEVRWTPGVIDTIFDLPVETRIYIEVDLKITNPTHLRIWINGTQQVDLTGIDEYSPNLIETIAFSGRKPNYALQPFYYDDLYLIDAADASQGTKWQQRLGPISIRPIPAVSDGFYNEWTPFNGGTRFSEIDEQPGPNDLDATYNFVTTSLQRQLFNVSAVNDIGSTIHAVTPFAVIKQPDPTNGLAQISFLTRQSSIDRLSLWDVPLYAVYRMADVDFVTLPDGSPITRAGIEAVQWGLRSEEDNSV